MESYGNGKASQGTGLLERDVEVSSMPDPEVSGKPRRRSYSAEYKRRILNDVDRCTEKGAIGALLRREGLHSSHLTLWRKERERWDLEALAPKKRGRKGTPVNPLSPRVRELEKENRRLEKKLKQAELVIEVQKKISDLLGVEQPEIGGKRG